MPFFPIPGAMMRSTLMSGKTSQEQRQKADTQKFSLRNAKPNLIVWSFYGSIPAVSINEVVQSFLRLLILCLPGIGIQIFVMHTLQMWSISNLSSKVKVLMRLRTMTLIILHASLVTHRA